MDRSGPKASYTDPANAFFVSCLYIGHKQRFFLMSWAAVGVRFTLGRYEPRISGRMVVVGLSPVSYEFNLLE
jgi:hypothetical protein